MNLLRKIKSFGILLLLAMVIFSCRESSKTNPDSVYAYKVPAYTGDGWETASLSDAGMDEAPLTQFMNELINNLEHKIHSILIIKDGKLVFEEYFSGYEFYHGPLTEFNRDIKHNLASVTKSFTSAITGLAIDQGLIQDVDQKVFSFFPEYIELKDEEKDKITLEHLLTMTSGLEWDESTYPYTDSRNDVAQLIIQSDPIRFVLNRPVLTEPGTTFLYSGGSTIVLGEIIRKASGLRADSFAGDYLFAPLGIDDYQWEEMHNNVLYTSGDLKLRPRDMAKLGDLYLHGGSWKGKEIISGEWVDASTRSFINTLSEGVSLDYGYKWWLYTYDVNDELIESYSARGWGGQNIIVFPSLNLVLVTTAGYYDEPHLEFHIGGFLIPQVLSSAM